MKFRSRVIIFFLLITKSVFGLNVTIIESQSYNIGHVMDLNWQAVATGMGYSAIIYPQSTLNTTAFYASTDILIISSGVITLTPTAMSNIIGYIGQGGRAYIEGEYDCSNYNTNSVFENMVAQFGGGPFNYLGTVAGTLVPMNVLGSLSTTNNAVSSLSYYWYGCRGLPGACSIVEPFLEYNGDYFGFIYCAPNTNGGRVIQTTDQDWVNQNTSTQLMENILNNLASNNYNCSSLINVGVNLGADISICNGQSTFLDAGNSGATYLWSTGATTQTISINSSGTYWVNVNNGACQGSDTITVSIQNTFAVSLGNDTIVCSGQSLTLDAGNPGQTYLWNTNATTQNISVNATGIYSVTVGNGTCTVSDTIFITVPFNGSLNLGADTAICSGEILILNAGNAGSTYAWSTGASAQTIIVLAAGTYTVTVTNACLTQSNDIIVAVNPAPVYALNNDTTYCNNFSLQLNAGNAGANYLWSTGSTAQFININLPANYWVTISNNCGSIVDSIVLLQYSTPVVFLGNDTLYCSAFNRILIATNAGATYLWSTTGSSATINVNAAGNYWVVATNTCGTATDTITITQSSLPVSVLASDTIYCADFSLLLTAGIAPEYLWSNASTNQTITVNQPGIYWVRMTNNCGVLVDTIHLIQTALPDPELGNDTVYCGNFSVDYDVNCVACSYLWSTGSTDAEVTINNSTLLLASVANQCGVAVDSVLISQQPIPYLLLAGDTLLCPPDGFVITTITNATVFLWSTGASSSSLTISSAGVYWCRVSNDCGSVNDSIIITSCSGQYIMASGFSPNSDGHNDFLFPIRIGDASLLQFEVYNRWGQQVYTSTGMNGRWNGTYKSATCETGVYAYLVKYKDNVSGSVFTLKGNATLLR